MKRRALTWGSLVLALTIIVAGAIYWPHLHPSPKQTVTLLSGESSVSGAIRQSFEFTEKKEDRFSTRTTFTNARQQILQLETIADIDTESAQTLIQEGMMGIEALYSDALSPYPENLSRQVTTSESYRPKFFRKEIRGVLYHYFLLYASERLTYGAASDETVRRRSLLGWIYCEKQRLLHKIRLFSPLNTPTRELEEFFLGLPCG